MTVKLHCFRKLVGRKENCTFDDSDGMGWYTGGLASHQGTLKLAQVSGKDLKKMTKDERKLFFFLHLTKTKFKKKRKEKHNAKNILSSHAYNLTVALGYL